LTTAVVVTFNSARWIEACLTALVDVPTIVVDNASTDGTVEMVRERFPGVRLVERSSNGGYAVAVNEGWRLAAPDDVLVLNPDVVAGNGSIGALERHLKTDAQVGVAVPTLVNPDGTTQTSIRTFPSPLTMLARRSPFGRTRLGRAVLKRHIDSQLERSEPRPVDWAIGAAMLVRHAAIVQVGGMDERLFLYGEDVDWCYRMWQRGWHVHLVPDAVMEHAYERLSRRTLDLRSAATRHHWASIAKLYALHPGLLVGRSPRNV
jgi:N-acetylglucosaminyl-diphospho-decaprenol L-rhamnosyltransferase